MFSFFICFSISQNIDLCWRTDDSLDECEEPFDTEIRDEKDFEEYFGQNIFLEVVSSKEHPAFIDKYAYGITNLTVVGHNSYLFFNFSGIKRMPELRLHSLGSFCFFDSNITSPVQFDYLEISNTQIIGDHINLVADTLKIDLIAAKSFKSITAMHSIVLDSNIDSISTEKKEKIILHLGSDEDQHSSTIGTAEIVNIPNSSRITSDEVNAYLTINKTLTIELHNPDRWTTQFDVYETNKVFFQQPDDDIANSIVIKLDNTSSLEIEEFTEETDYYFANVIAVGDRNEIIFGKNASVNLEIKDFCILTTPNEEINLNKLIISEQSQLLFDNDEYTTQTIANINTISISQNSLITSYTGVNLTTKRINIQDTDMAEYVIGKEITILGYPDFYIKNANAVVGNMEASSIQRFDFVTDFNHNNGIEFAQMYKLTNNKLSFGVTLSLSDDSQQPSDDLLRPLLEKELKLITIDETANPLLLQKGFCPKERFEINSQLDGFSQGNSVIETYCTTEESTTESQSKKAVFGYKIANLPSVTNLHICLDSSSRDNCPDDESTVYIQQFDEVRNHLTEATKHVRLYIPSEQTLSLSNNFGITHDVQYTLQTYYKKSYGQAKTVHILCSDALCNSHISQFKFEDIIVDFITETSSSSPFVLTIPLLIFNCNSDLTQESRNKVTFSPNTFIEIALNLLSLEEFKGFSNVKAYVDDDTVLTYKDDLIEIQDSENSVELYYTDYSQTNKLNISVSNGNQLAFINETTKFNSEKQNILDVSGNNIIFYFFNFTSNVATVDTSGDCEIASGDYIPITFLNNSVTSLYFKGEETSRISKQIFKDNTLNLIKDKYSTVIFDDVELISSSINGDEDMINNDDMIKINTVQIKQENTESSLSFVNIQDKIVLDKQTTLNLTNVLFDKTKTTKIEGYFSLLHKSSLIHFKHDENINDEPISAPNSIVYTFLLEDDYFKSLESNNKTSDDYKETVITIDDKTNILGSITYKLANQPKKYDVNFTIKQEGNDIIINMHSQRKSDSSNNESNGAYVTVIIIFSVLIVACIILAVVLYFRRKKHEFNGVDSASLVFESSTDEITKMV